MIRYIQKGKPLRTFILVSFWTLVLPWTSMLLMILVNGLLGLVLSGALSIYFLPPSLMFGEPHFTVKIGAGPNTVIGALMSVGFYIVVSGFITLVIWGVHSIFENPDGAPTNEVIETASSESSPSIHHFTRTKAVNHFFWGFVGPDDADIEKVIADAVKQNSGTRAINIKIEFKQTFLKNLVGVVTIGIYLPRTLKIEGDVVK